MSSATSTRLEPCPTVCISRVATHKPSESSTYITKYLPKVGIHPDLCNVYRLYSTEAGNQQSSETVPDACLHTYNYTPHCRDEQDRWYLLYLYWNIVIPPSQHKTTRFVLDLMRVQYATLYNLRRYIGICIETLEVHDEFVG